MSTKTSTKLQPRDRELLTLLTLSPFGATQLANISVTFQEPFASEKLVRRRMLRLAEAGLVEHFHYQTNTIATEKYYKLTREGYRFVAGHGKTMPRRSFFAPISPSLQNHTRHLSDFIVHTLTTAHLHNVKVLSFYGENQLELRLGDRSARLDAAAQLKVKSYLPKNCLFELDCGTEPVVSNQQRESLSQKVRFIYDYATNCKSKFWHYMVFAAATPRMSNYLQMVADLNPNPQRSICFAVLLDRYLETADPLRSPIFLDQHNCTASILPSSQMNLIPQAMLQPSLEQELAVA